MAKQAAILGSRGGVHEFVMILARSVMVGRRRTMGVRINRQNSQLARSVSEEAHLSLAILAIFTSLSSVPCRVKPTLEDAVRELAAITAAAPPAAILGADSTGVVIPAGVSAASFLTGVSEGAVGPVMAAAAGASAYLELVHAEVIRGIEIRVVGVGVGVEVVAGEKLAKESLVGRGKAGGVGEHVGVVDGGGGGGTASEELAGRDVEEGLLRGEGMELVLVSTDAAHDEGEIDRNGEDGNGGRGGGGIYKRKERSGGEGEREEEAEAWLHQIRDEHAEEGMWQCSN